MRRISLKRLFCLSFPEKRWKLVMSETFKGITWVDGPHLLQVRGHREAGVQFSWVPGRIYFTRQTTKLFPKQPKLKVCRKRLKPDGCPGREEEEEGTCRALHQQGRYPRSWRGREQLLARQEEVRETQTHLGRKLSPDGKSGNLLNPQHPRMACQSSHETSPPLLNSILPVHSCDQPLSLPDLLGSHLHQLIPLDENKSARCFKTSRLFQG